MFPGNTADVSTIEKIRSDLRGWNLGRAMFVADSGMNSEENRTKLARACGKYLLACRMASVAEVKGEVLSKRGRYTVFRDNLHAKEVVIGDGERRKRYILCYNPKEAERQEKHRQTIVELLEYELGRHKDQSVTAQWAIERCFRSLKRTQIKMTPMYHWASRRIKTHVKICVLALLMERLAELECGKFWSQIRYSLDKLKITEFFDLNYRMLMRYELPQDTANILKSLKIKSP